MGLGYLDLNVSSLRGVVDKMLDCDIVVSDLEYHSRYYVDFRTTILEKKHESIFSAQRWIK